MKGEITIFLSLILTCICALMGGLLESARAAGSGWYLQASLDSATDSLMSQYHRDLWEDYRLLLLEFEETEQLRMEMEPYLSAYLDTDSSFLLEPEELSVEEPVRITDEGGRYLEQEILDYMKLGILTMEQDPEKIGELKENVKEAASLGEITKHYQLDTRKAIRLEQALEDIGASLKKQEQYLESGKESLEHCNGRDFLTKAERLEKEIRKMPGLISGYESAADDLARELEASRTEAEEKRGDLKEETWRAVSDGMDQYRSYTDQEGERRLQVLRTGEQAEQNLRIVEDAIEETEETLAYIDEWEPDDEDDELDEEPLWNAVLRTVSRFRTDHSFSEPGIQDKKTMNLLQSISRMAEGELLALVMPEGKKVSPGKADWSGFPSQEGDAKTAGNTGTGFGALNPIEGLLETALIDEYIAHFFANVLSGETKELNYEQEYLITGGDTDQENLRGVVNRLLLVREAMNLIHLLSDSEKRGEAQQLAAAVLGAASLSPLTAVVSFFILTVWAFAESVEDLRALLRGEKVPFLKSRESWKLSLDQLIHSDGAGNWAGSGGISGQEEKGMSYQDYLKLFFLVQERGEKNYRMMDLMQLNIAGQQSGFQMAQCAYGIEARCRAKGRRITLTRSTVKAY